jgi:hypothetical protein
MNNEMYSKLNSRYFNKVIHSRDRNVVTKTSINEDKLLAELYWYLRLPSSFKQHIPQINKYSDKPGNVFIEMEYISYPALSTHFVNDSLSVSKWTDDVFPAIGDILQKFKTFDTKIDYEVLSKIYITKTYNRLKEFVTNNQIAWSIYKKGFGRFNGSFFQCPLRFLETNTSYLSKILLHVHPSIIHGDLCFSNILYNEQTKDIKLIDPRGSFGTIGLFGDHFYDFAKLNHSLSGYDHIIADQFDITINNLNIDFVLHKTPIQTTVQKEWKKIFDDSIVNLIEALLFLSMLPLHSDQYKRQLVMYALGVTLLQNTI